MVNVYWNLLTWSDIVIELLKLWIFYVLVVIKEAFLSLQHSIDGDSFQIWRVAVRQVRGIWRSGDRASW